VIDEDAPHHLGRDPEEVRAVLPGDVALSGEPHVGLVDQCRRLEGVVRTLLAQVGGGEPAQLSVHERHQLLERLSVAPSPLLQEGGDFRIRRLRHRPVGCPFDGIRPQGVSPSGGPFGSDEPLCR
jgi:hypothetical protein